MTTKKYDTFILELDAQGKKPTPSAQLLWRWIERNRKELGIEQDIDLEKFNKWIAKKRGRGYDHKTLRNAIAGLENAGIIQIIKKYHHWCDYRIICYSIEYLLERDKICPQKKTRTEEKYTILPGHSQELETSNSNHYSENSYEITCNEQQQQITLIDRLTRDAGLVFDRKTLSDFVRYGVDQVHKSIELLKLRSLTKVIDNPHGFIVECLRWKWWKDKSRSEWKNSITEMKDNLFRVACLKLHSWTRKYDITYDDCCDLALELKELVFEQ